MPPALPFGDTWQLDGQTWTQLQTTGLEGRWQHAMSFDSSREQLAMFGGSASVAALADTWQTPGDIEPGVTLTSFCRNLGEAGGGRHLAAALGSDLARPAMKVSVAAGGSTLGLIFHVPDSLRKTNLDFVATLDSLSITQLVGPDGGSLSIDRMYRPVFDRRRPPAPSPIFELSGTLTSRSCSDGSRRSVG